MPEATWSSSARAEDSKCAEARPLERVRYYPAQLITADDMRAEQDYFRGRSRLHNRHLFGWGVVCGFTVTHHEDERGDPDPFVLKIGTGYALGPQGDEIFNPVSVTYDLTPWTTGARSSHPATWRCLPRDAKTQEAWLAVRYTECEARPQRVHPAGCGCSATHCETSRIRDGFALTILTEKPESTIRLDEWQRQVQQFPRTGFMPCLPCLDDPWVELAKLTLRPGELPVIERTASTPPGIVPLLAGTIFFTGGG